VVTLKALCSIAQRWPTLSANAGNGHDRCLNAESVVQGRRGGAKFPCRWERFAVAEQVRDSRRISAVGNEDVSVVLLNMVSVRRPVRCGLALTARALQADSPARPTRAAALGRAREPAAAGGSGPPGSVAASRESAAPAPGRALLTRQNGWPTRGGHGP